MRKIYLTCTENGSNKFWEARVNGNVFTVEYGAIGASPQVSEKHFDDNYDANDHFDKMVKSKLKKGYVKEQSQKDLEKEFTDLQETVGKQIQKGFDAYHTELSKVISLREKTRKEAIALAEKHGLPFPVELDDARGQENGCYIPSTFKSKFGKLDQEFVADIVEISSYYINDYDGDGWMTSSC
jgi:predicted DNA-binding WGR domain protein